MATKKKSRLKFLPPRLQLNERSAMTGSFPTVARFSIDGRTGNYPVNYDDTKTINFQNKSVGNLYRFLELRNSIILYIRPDVEGGISGDPPDLTYSMLPSYMRSVDELHSEFVSVDHVGQVFGSAPNPTPGRIFRYGPTGDHTLITDTSGLDLLNFFDKAFPDEFTTPFSVSLHVRTDSTDNVGKTIVSIARSSQYDMITTRVFQITFNPTTKIVSVFANMDGASMSCVMSSNQFTPVFNGFPGLSFWIHFSYDGSNTIGGMKLYVTEDFYGTTNEFHTNKSIAQVPVSLGTGDCVGVLGKFSPSFGGSWNGEIDQFCIFDRELSQEEFNLLTSNGAGSYVADAGGSYLGVGLPIESPFLSTNPQQLQNETTTLFGTANLVKGIGDATPMVHFTPGQEGGPFRDNDQYAVDGKSDEDPFFAVGTTVADGGEGFTSPLWSKNKIEIDIGCASTANIPFVTSGAFVGSTNNEGDRPTPTWHYENRSYPMAYYNFNSKRWEGIGTGVPHGTVGGTGFTVSPYTDYFYQGFAPSIVNVTSTEISLGGGIWRNVITGAFEFQASAGQPISNFGFPHHPKYHATGSQTFKLRDVINKPFLVEKIVIEMSASYSFNESVVNTANFRGNSGQTITDIREAYLPACVSNVFILNQRKNVKVNYRERMEQTPSTNFATDRYSTTIIPTTIQLSTGSAPVYVNTIRDVITWGGVCSYTDQLPVLSQRVGTNFLGVFGSTPTFNSPRTLMSRDINIQSNTSSTTTLKLSWDSKLLFKLLPKTMNRIDRNDTIGTYPNDANMFGLECLGPSANVGFFDMKNSNGGSNNLGVLYPTGRNASSPLKDINAKGAYQSNISFNKEVVIVEDSNRYKVSPYILLPSDELIIGWQQPIPLSAGTNENVVNSRDMAAGTLSTTTFPQGPAKVVLYGSYISEGVEDNDSLNQLLSSESVHEIIGED